MAGRRLLLFVVLLIAIGAVASATVPREEDPPVRRTTPAPAVPAQAGPGADVVVGRVPGKRGGRGEGGGILRGPGGHRAADGGEGAAPGLAGPGGPGGAARPVF